MRVRAAPAVPRSDDASGHDSLKVAVVGAGIAGLACARGVASIAATPVTVFERGELPGGRVATMRTEIGGFDHGAQYFTARDAAFVAQVDAWLRAGVVEPWDVAPRLIGADGAPAAGRAVTPQRWVGVPGMSAVPCRDGRRRSTCAAHDRDVARARPRDGAAGWTLHTRDGDDVARDPTSAFDVVVAAVPAAPAAVLLGASPSLAEAAATARIEPCWALLAGFAEPIETGEPRVGDAAFVDGGRLAWIAREPSKPGRRVGERWTVHAQSGWSVEHFDDDPEDIKAKLLRAFHDATGTIEQPVYATVTRWRHALARTSIDRDFLWDPERRVGACGDWCRGYRVEDAWLSGTALAKAIGASS